MTKCIQNTEFVPKNTDNVRISFRSEGDPGEIRALFAVMPSTNNQ